MPGDDGGSDGVLDGRRASAGRADRPGSDGEHLLQERFGTVDRADAFYDSAMQSELTDRMAGFLAERWLGVVGFLDDGNPRVAPCVSDPGMVRIVESDLLAWPTETVLGDDLALDGPPADRWLSLVTVDWWDSTVGLHVNGVAERRPRRPEGIEYDGPRTDWIVLAVEEAYIHCAKHVPRLTVVEGPPDESSGQPTRESHDHLSAEVQRFVESRRLAFLATADDDGETDVSPRLGPRGFVQVLDEGTVAWPEYRGNGIHASLGNVHERPAASLLFVDWWTGEGVVQVSGTASLRESVDGATDVADVGRTKTWVVLDVESVDLTRGPPLPELSVEEFDPPWGTDDREAKKSGFFTE